MQTRHRVRIEASVPRADLVVARDPAERRDNEDLYASIDAAFDDACRMIHDHVAARRDEQRHAKRHRI